jgi:hypothetical protein
MVLVADPVIDNILVGVATGAKAAQEAAYVAL